MGADSPLRVLPLFLPTPSDKTLMTTDLRFSSSTAASPSRDVQTSLVKGAASRETLLQRALLIILFTTVTFGVCAYRLAQLQLVSGETNRVLAEQNRTRLVPIRSDRGNILDRRGELIGANRLSRAVYFWPRQQSPEDWHVLSATLAPLLNVPQEEMLSKLEQAGYNSPLPVRIAQQLSPDAFVALAEFAQQFPGVEILAESNRYYPHNALAAHIIGYIGEATEADMRANPDYPNGMIVGQMGIERLMNPLLEGQWGNRLVEVDANGRERSIIGNEPAISGEAVHLTIDLKLQQVAERALNNRRGAVVALDVNTGEVLVLASGPSFDPNIFTRRVTDAEWQQLQGESQPFLNRALQGYPPGSTFKIVTAVAGMQSGHFNPGSILNTSAFITVGGTQFWEHSNQGYGPIGFRDALAVSSNTFFYQVGMTAGPEAIAHWGAVMGIGTTPTLGLEGGNTGVIPTPEEKMELYGEPWYTGDTVSMSIGQGVVQVTPLEMAVMTAVIANGGYRVIPHLVMAQTSLPEMQPVPTGIDPGAIAVIRDGLVATVRQGTAQGLNDGSIPLTGGKTGTSEVLGQPSHSLFVGYGPADNPQIAIAAIVENGGFGSTNAMPIAHEIYKAFFNR
jgi:penicillin-binding protein 2